MSVIVRPLTPQGAGFLSKDRTIGYISLTLRDSPPSLITGERDLPGHLKGEHEKDVRKDKAPAHDAIDDYALSEAVNLLKGMALQNHPTPGPQKQVAEKSGEHKG